MSLPDLFETASNSGYLLGAGSLAFAWASSVWWNRWWRRRGARRVRMRQLELAERTLASMKRPEFFKAWHQANIDIRTIDSNAVIPPEDFSYELGWTDCACGRGICAMGFGHAGRCVF